MGGVTISLMIIQPSSTVASTTTMTIMVMRLSTMMCSNFFRNACMQSSNIEGDLGCQGRLYAQLKSAWAISIIALRKSRIVISIKPSVSVDIVVDTDDTF